MQNNRFVRLFYSLNNGLAIQRGQRTQVNDLQFDAFLRQNLSSFERGVNHGRVGNHADVAAFARNS